MHKNKNPPFYEDLLIFFGNIISNFKNWAVNNEFYVKFYRYSRYFDKIGDRLSDDELAIEDVIEFAEADAYFFINNITEIVNKTDDQEAIQQMSQTLIREFKKEIDNYLKEARRDGFLNIDKVKELIERHQSMYKNCRYLIWALACVTATVEDSSTTDISTIMKYGNVS